MRKEEGQQNIGEVRDKGEIYMHTFTCACICIHVHVHVQRRDMLVVQDHEM